MLIYWKVIVLSAKGCCAMLTKRQLLILNNIIEHFTREGQPVSSKTLVDDGSVEASSATIRNEMSLLEELDFIEKVHSSSGRVPSVKGYRFYVDHLMSPKLTNENVRHKIKSFMNNHIFQMSDIFYQSAELLSELTNYTAIVLGPQSKSNIVTGFRIVPLNHQQMVIVMQLDNYDVQSMIFRIPDNLSSNHIKQVTDFMNKNLVGESLATVHQALRNDLPQMFEKYLEMNWDVVGMLEQTLLHSKEDQTFISGKMNILDFSENMDIHQVKSLYKLLDNEGTIISLFDTLYKDKQNFDIRIGDEFGNQLFTPFSLMSVPYQDEYFGNGFIAVLGPKNMSYDTTLGVIEVLREELLDRLGDFYLE